MSPALTTSRGLHEPTVLSLLSWLSALLLVLAIVVIQVMRVEEKKAANLNELFRDLIRHNPVRVWMRR